MSEHSLMNETSNALTEGEVKALTQLDLIPLEPGKITHLPLGYTVNQISTNPDLIADQALFCQTFDHLIGTHPHFPEEKTRRLAFRLIDEEANKELLPVLNNFSPPHPPINPQQPIPAPLNLDTLVEIADGLVDLVYVCLDTAHLYGIPFAAVWRAVQTANMAKLWTKKEAEALFDENNNLKPEYRGWTSKVSSYRPLKKDANDTDPPTYLVLDQNGKVKKPPSWTPPNVRQILLDAITANAPICSLIDLPAKERE